MWGAILGAVTSVAGGVTSALAQSRAAKIREEELKKREQRQAATYARRANQDYTQRADAQRMLQTTREALQKRAEAAAGRQAVMGTTDSGLAAEREMAGEVMADTASRIAAAGEAQKDEAEKTYEAQQDANAKERVDIAAGQASATGEAVGQMVSGVGQAVASLGDMGFTKSSLDIPANAGNISKPTLNTTMPTMPKVGIQGVDASKIKTLPVTIGRNVPGYSKI